MPKDQVIGCVQEGVSSSELVKKCGVGLREALGDTSLKKKTPQKTVRHSDLPEGMRIVDDTREIYYGGEWLTFPQAAKKYNMNVSTLSSRVIQRKWSIKDAIETPINTAFHTQVTRRLYKYNGREWTVRELCETFAIKKSTLKSRLRSGMSVEEAINTPLRRRKSKKHVKKKGGEKKETWRITPHSVFYVGDQKFSYMEVLRNFNATVGRFSELIDSGRIQTVASVAKKKGLRPKDIQNNITNGMSFSDAVFFAEERLSALGSLNDVSLLSFFLRSKILIEKKAVPIKKACRAYGISLIPVYKRFIELDSFEPSGDQRVNRVRKAFSDVVFANLPSASVEFDDKGGIKERQDFQTAMDKESEQMIESLAKKSALVANEKFVHSVGSGDDVIFVAFGRELLALIADRSYDKIAFEDPKEKGVLAERKFSTEAEGIAYQQGLDDSAFMEEYGVGCKHRIVTAEVFKRLSAWNEIDRVRWNLHQLYKQTDDPKMKKGLIKEMNALAKYNE